MNREDIFKAIADIDERFIAESAAYAPEAASGSSERTIHMKKKRIITFALAAALIFLLGIAAYATIFSMKFRFPEARETFRVDFETNPDGYAEWKNVKLAITFPDVAKSKEIEFRPNWLPEEMALLENDPLKASLSYKYDSGWFRYFTAEKLVYPDYPEEKVPEYEGMFQPLQIETYSMSQFNNGGALVLLVNTPSDFVEEHWDELNVDVLRFHCTQHFDAVPQLNKQEYTLEKDIILLSNTDAGWIIRVCGEIGMDELIKVAKNLEIRKTGKTFTYDDFEGNHYRFIDAAVG